MKEEAEEEGNISKKLIWEDEDKEAGESEARWREGTLERIRTREPEKPEE
jgi:hypothetical protein